ncbi:hypothetical protein SEA_CHARGERPOWER_65 [Mycobacterium phage Chargerpower]|nr:hypothetical protein SEA_CHARGERPOWER_65 [Mycobacterium phage Chargerpower]
MRGIGPVLFIVFLVLKLTDNIDWSWWWVAAPIWIPASILLVGLALTGAISHYGYETKESK